MEWLAYLIFPVLVLLLYALHRKVPTWVLVIAWWVALAPLLWRGSLTIDPYYTELWGSVIRVLTEFTAGAITYLIVLRLIPRARAILRRAWSAAPPSSRCSCRCWSSRSGLPGNWTTAQSPITLAIRMPSRCRRTSISGSCRPSSSGSEPWLCRAADRPLARHGHPDPGRRGLVLALHDAPGVVRRMARGNERDRHRVWPHLRAVCRLAIAGAFVIAWLMWRIVEEPCRRWMRRLAGARAIARRRRPRIRRRGARSPTAEILAVEDGFDVVSVQQSRREDHLAGAHHHERRGDPIERHA